ncbi:MAG: hypothetical protein WCF72_21900, partial [Pseudolabrys sp.]
MRQPRGAELGPARHNEQHASAADPADDLFKQLECRGVQPVCILEDTERGKLQRTSQEHIDKRADRPVFYLLCGQLRQ